MKLLIMMEGSVRFKAATSEHSNDVAKNLYIENRQDCWYQSEALEIPTAF